MKISLAMAHRIRTKLETASIPYPDSVIISHHDQDVTIQSVTALIEEHDQAVATYIEASRRKSAAICHIRELIGTANELSGVNHALTKRAEHNRDLIVLRSILDLGMLSHSPFVYYNQVSSKQEGQNGQSVFITKVSKNLGKYVIEPSIQALEASLQLLDLKIDRLNATYTISLQKEHADTITSLGIIFQEVDKERG